jgi:hypothetical protein
VVSERNAQRFFGVVAALVSAGLVLQVALSVPAYCALAPDGRLAGIRSET